MAIIILEPGEAFEHYHSAESSTGILQGTVSVSFADQDQTLHPGDKILIPAQTPHVLRNLGSSEARVLCAKHKDI